MTLLVTSAEMRAIEADAVSRGATWHGLMDHAGDITARLFVDHLGHSTQQKVLVLVGPGNNGGDALVVARHLVDHGWQVRCFTWVRRSENDARLRDPLQERKVSVAALSPETLTRQLGGALQWCSVVVDGLLGTGLQRDIQDDIAAIIDEVATSERPIMSIDIPTGVDSDTGAVRGAALQADFTVALGLLKYGHALQPGKKLSGKISLGEIGLSTQASRSLASGELLTDSAVADMLPERADDANKGTFGKAMIVAGSINYMGAAALATEGAMRTGVGLVTLACAGDLLRVVAAHLLECTFIPLPSDMGATAGPAAEKVKSSVEGYTALLVGCGLGDDKETVQFLRRLLQPQESSSRPAARSMGFGFAVRSQESAAPEEDKPATLPPLVLDADALNILSGWEDWPNSVPPGSVLTPHPGEMARLMGSTVEDVQKDRVKAATECAREWKQVVVLKGASTVIAGPDGKVYVSPFSNPALATAGTGDVLAGAIAGMLAQGLAPLQAACAGVYLHGMAGELLREEYGVAGGLAGDLPVLLARAQKRLRESAIADGKR